MPIDWIRVEAPTWAQAKGSSRYRDDRSPRLDPYLIWADVNGFADLEVEPSNPEQRYPVILELKEPATTFAQRCIDENWDWIRVPSVYRCAPEWLKSATFCTATVTRQAFGKFDRELKGYVRRFQLGSPVFSDTDVDSDTRKDDYDARDHPCLARESSSSSPVPLPVVVGIIDEGLAFAHERFCEIVGGRPASRVEYFWNQNEESKRDCPVRGLGYGTELSRGEIGQLLAEAKHGNQVDEDQLYREAGHRTVERRILHGTHVMDLACGEALRNGTADSLRMICVELPRQTVRDTSGLSLAVHALDGIRYVLDRAACFSRAVRGKAVQTFCPVVVNLSYGNIAGPHDGSSMLEAAIDELIGLGRGGDGHGKLQVVLPAGNNLLSRCHARTELAAGDEETLDWRILPDDATPSFLEIWFAGGDEQHAVAIEVTPPGGQGSGWVSENEVLAGKLDGDAVCTVVYLDRVATGNGRMILVAVAPTTTTLADRRVAPAGNWRVRIRHETRRSEGLKARKSAVTINAWIQRDDKPMGFPRRGRQSRFDDARYIRFDSRGRLEEDDGAASIIKRAGTLNAIGTGTKTIVIGGYRKADGAAAAYSASGTPTGNGRVGPDAMAISERSIVRHGVLGAGGRSGSRVAMGGTSVAAPRVTRWIAGQLAKGFFPDRKSVIKLAKQFDPDGRRIRKEGQEPKPPAERGGGGRLPLLEKGED